MDLTHDMRCHHHNNNNAFLPCIDVSLTLVSIFPMGLGRVLFNKFSRDRDIHYLNCRLSLKIKNWCLIDFHITCVWMIHHQIATSLINICYTTNFIAHSDHINSFECSQSVRLTCTKLLQYTYEAAQMSRNHINSMILYNLVTSIRDRFMFLDREESFFYSV